ncbi:hypothetical protein [Yaniella halotolerans]|uniref:hypothetical protein n=1 Tax=Yaniella halotolerans TaxID=225453 RepID=UPI0003B3601F|nr:hypothetical protein [Yaniella halotolerans]
MSQQPPPPPPLPAVLRGIPAQAWTRALLIVVVFFAGSVVMAGSIAGLLTVGMNAAFGNGAAGEFAELVGSSWIVLTFQILAMGFLSPLSMGVDFSDFGMFAAGGSLFLVPWWVPIGGLIAVAATQRFLGGNLRAPRTGVRFLMAGVAGLLFAGIVTILAAVIRFRVVENNELFGIAMWAHAASLPGFLVAALLVGCITYVLFLPRRGKVVERAMTVLAAVWEHVIVVSGLAAVATVIALLSQGDTQDLVPIVALLPSVGFLMFSLMHFIPASATGHEELTGNAEHQSITIFEAPAVVWITVILVVLLALCVSAFRWTLRTRFHAHAGWAWLALPVTYLLVGILLTAGNGMYFSMFAEGEGLRFSVSSAVWGFLIWLVLGAIVQLLAVYVMPGLAQRFPASVVRVLGLGLTVPRSQPVEPRRPMQRKTKVLLWTSLGVVALAAVAWITHTVLGRTVYGPEETAEAYLQAVVDGRADDALELLGPNVTDQQRALATDEVYQQATDRPDRFELGDVDFRQDQVNDAVMQATIYQSGKAYPIELGLAKAGTQAGVFDDWELRSGDVAGGAMYLSGPSHLTVNGVEVEVEPFDPSGETASSSSDIDPVLDKTEFVGQILLPGTYTFAAPEGNEYLSHGDDLELTITPGEFSETPIEFNQRYTEAFETDVIAEVEQRLEACVANETIRIDDCDAASWEDTGWNAMTNIQRTWATTPEVELVPAETEPYADGSDITDSSGPVVARIVEGDITVTYEVRDDEDQDWSERERTYPPFGGWGDAMEFPVTLNGDEIQIDYSALDEPNPSWLSQEFRD